MPRNTSDRVGAVARRPRRPAGGSPDLSYLHPTTLRIGGVGVFAGDWAYTEPAEGQPARIPVGFVGLLVDRWNGFAVFAVTREVAEAIVADQQRLRDAEAARLSAEGLDGTPLYARRDEAFAPMRFDGDDIVVDQRAVYGDDPDALWRVAPGADGRYTVGWAWTWLAVDAADCDRITGQIPPRRQHQEYVMLVHTPDLRVPHDRLKVSSLQQIPTHNGVAFTAELTLDGQYAGTIENDGNGGPTTYFGLNSSAFNGRHLGEYVEGCRHRGQPVSQEFLLDALADEFQLGRQVADATAAGATLVRLLDEHGFTVEMHGVRRAPRSGPDRAALIAELAARPPHPLGHAWHIWTGTAWRHLAQARPAGRAGEPS